MRTLGTSELLGNRQSKPWRLPSVRRINPGGSQQNAERMAVSLNVARSRMQQFLSNGGLSKMLWIILMFAAGLGSLVMLFIEIGNGQPPNAYVLSILSGVLTHGATVGGHILGKSAPEAPHTSITGGLPNVVNP